MTPQMLPAGANSADASASWQRAGFRMHKLGKSLGRFMLAALMIFTTIIFDLAAISGAPRSTSDSIAATFIAMLSFVAAIPIAFSLLWRTREPWIVLALQAVGVLVFAISGVGAVFVLPSILAHREHSRQPVRALAAIAATVAIITTGALLELQKAPNHRVLMTHDPVTGEFSVMTWWGYLIAGVVVMMLAIAWGLMRRYRLASAEAEHQAAIQTGLAQSLRSEVGRQQERERIAAEMHDTVAHQLSLVSLHAAALQVTTADPATVESARAIHGLGHRALEEMRVMISSLRDSQGSGYTGSSPTFEHLHDLVRDAQATGFKVDATLDIAEAQGASVALARAAFRVTQEALTNAIRYGSEQRAHMTVTARKGEPVIIEVKNPFTPESTAKIAPGSTGAGIPGMEQRVRVLAGVLTSEPKNAADPKSGDSMMWIVQAHIPWSEND